MNKKKSEKSTSTLDSIKTQAFDYLCILNKSYAAKHDIFKTLAPVREAIVSDGDYRLEYGEFIGYSYGGIEASTNMIDVSIENLEAVLDGAHDSLDSAALVMLISLWYNIAEVELVSFQLGITELETLESELFGGNAETAALFNKMESTTIH